MKLVKVLDQLNSIEKNSFLNIVSDISNQTDAQTKKSIDKILSEGEGQLKNVDHNNIAKVFSMIRLDYGQYVKQNLIYANPQLDFLIDILLRDGNCIMSREWFHELYEKERKALKKKVKEYKEEIDQDDNLEARTRDFKTFYNCVKTAYLNDRDNNQEPTITTDEQTILLTLAKSLGLSSEERRIITFMVLPLEKLEIDDLIKDLNKLGIIFFSKKQNTLYIPDEFVKLFRELRGKEVADKYFRRVLNHLMDSQINMVCRAHNIDWKLSRQDKIKEIINVGADFRDVLLHKIFKPETKVTDRKAFINELTEKKLKIDLEYKGTTNEEKVDNLIQYFNQAEQDSRIAIAFEGYEQLLKDLKDILPNTNKLIKEEFELQQENVLNSKLLLDYNIMPKDILYLLSEEDLKNFVEKMDISKRGDEIENIIKAYKDTQDIYIENYEAIANRDFNTLKENGIKIKEVEIGVKFEEVTKTIFEELGFTVSNELKKKFSDKKNQVDLILDLGGKDIILVECKTVKESGYNKFSSVSRQLKAYQKKVEDAGYRIEKILLVSNDFSSDFIEECNYQIELDLSLIKASSLVQILQAYKVSNLKEFPHILFLKDVLIDEERVVKAISK